MRTVLVMTRKETKHIEKATMMVAKAGLSLRECAAAMYKAAEAMNIFNDCVPILKENRNTIIKDGKRT